MTGVEHTLFLSPGPYVKVAIDPPDSLDPSSQTATVTLAGTLVAGNIAPEILRQVLRFIKANRDTLLDYWDYRTDTDQLRQRLQPWLGMANAGALTRAPSPGNRH